MNVQKTLMPFDLVSCPYVSLDGDVKRFANGDEQRGLFMVIAVDYNNMICAKVTSQSDNMYLNNSVVLTKAANYFLRTDSYVQLDKLHTLSVNSATRIGYVDKPSRYSIYKVLSGYLATLSTGLKRFANPPRKYVSPNRRYNHE